MTLTTPAASALPATPCYLNGEFSTLKDARISVLDRGFIFGDGVYEVVPACAGKLFRFAQHMARLDRNLVEKDGKVAGPPKDNLVLEGIRYGLIEEMCRALGLAFELRRMSRADVLSADELLLSSATKEILPVTLLDGQPVGNGKPGPVYAKLYTAYRQAIQEQST